MMRALVELCPERATYISVGQRPTCRAHNRIKAVGLAHYGGQCLRNIRKAYSLEIFCAPLRRALPYANIRKAFGLVSKAAFAASLFPWASHVHALIIYNGESPEDSAYETTAGMPAGLEALWDSVAFVSWTPNTFGASAVCLGGGFFLTAKHVWEVGHSQQVAINNAPYLLDTSFGSNGILNVEGIPGVTPAVDLKIFKVLSPPALPAVTLNRRRADVPRNGYAIGCGLGKGAAAAGEGWAWGGNATRAKRWGAVRITEQGVAEPLGSCLLSVFSTDYGADVASATLGDSGSGMFQKIRGEWVLSGITVAVTTNGSSHYNRGGGSPPDPDATLYVRIADYADAILSATSDITVGGVAIPGLWFRTHYPATAFCHYAALAGQAAANGVNTVAECYIAGLDPTDAASRFRATIAFSNNAPHIAWSPDLTPSRTYHVEGKTNLTDTTWCPTNNATRFFKVRVEM